MDFVTFEIAKKLKLKGFNEPCWNAINSFGCTYRNGWLEYLGEQDGELIVQNDLKECDYLLPIISQVLKWLREEKKLHIVCPYYEGKGFYFYVQEFGFGGRYNSIDKNQDWFESYEVAANAGIDYALDLV